ncbi:YshB family small membrane protein [Serratia sp. DD3]|nr:YshB family small membrane protein [Serratia sp. DD3]KEY57247.1 hypothetical protein SRDD_39180 [Serratia sp. DD3]
MLDSFIVFITQGADVSSAVSHTPLTAVAALLCATLINFFS